MINAVNVPSIAPEKLARLAPYMDLARKLGRVLCRMTDEPLTEVEIGVYGEAAKLDTHPIASAAMVGLLCEHHSVPVNPVNAIHLARRQGIQLTEVSSADSRDYVSLVRITAKSEKQSVCLEGTVFDERHPRLVRINRYEVESPLAGNLLFTRHADPPGVIGTLGEILGRRGINIARMQVGVADSATSPSPCSASRNPRRRDRRRHRPHQRGRQGPADRARCARTRRTHAGAPSPAGAVRCGVAASSSARAVRARRR